MTARIGKNQAISRALMMMTALSVSLFAATSTAHQDGISGYSGKTSNLYCNACHTGGTPPKVALLGPPSLTAGATATYTFVVTTSAAKVGLDVAATDGVTLTPGEGTQAKDLEITHDAPVATKDGTASFTFAVTAPTTNGRITIFAAGNATNGDGTSDGDAPSITTLAVDVTGGLAPAPADGGAGADAGIASGGGAASPPPSVITHGSVGDGGDGTFGPYRDEASHPDFADTGGCAIARAIPRRDPSVDGRSLALAVAALAATVARRARRVRRRGT